MSTNDASGDHAARLIFPALVPVYAKFGSSAEALLRIIAGLALVTHGYGKILEPLASIEMVEGLGFVPGELWSPLLAITEFFGGLFLACGFLTRPAALGTTIVLLVTVWFHWAVQGEGYSGAEKSILWAAMTFYFVIHGGGRYSVDRAIGREL